jgi:ketosteroid isomerase-like protein
MNRSLWGVLAAVLALTIFSSTPAAGNPVPAAEKAAIEKAIRTAVGWAQTKDRTLLESVMSRDDHLFIFNPDAHSTVGWSQFAKGFAFWMDTRFKSIRYDIRNLRLDISFSGTVAWWSCTLDELASWDGRPIIWEDTRWTGVLEKHAGQWLIMQMHYSFAAK